MQGTELQYFQAASNRVNVQMGWSDHTDDEQRYRSRSPRRHNRSRSPRRRRYNRDASLSRSPRRPDEKQANRGRRSPSRSRLVLLCSICRKPQENSSWIRNKYDDVEKLIQKNC